MSAREQMIRIIWDGAVADRVRDGKDLRAVPIVRPKVEAMADEILAEGWRPPARTITTEDELDALPTGSVVLSTEYAVLGEGGFWSVAFQRWDDGAWHRGARSASTHPDNFLPVTVLHEPEATK